MAIYRISLNSQTKKVLIFLFSILLNLSVCAQIKPKGIPFIQNYTKEDYEGASQIWSITQGYKGIIYVASDNGVIAFDGSYWRKYHVSHNVAARKVKAGSDGKLWVGGPNSFGYFHPNSSGRFRFNSLSDTVKPVNNDMGTVWDIFLLPDKKVLHTDKGIYAIYHDTTVFYKIKNVYTNVFRIENKIFVTDRENGLQVLTGKSFESFPDANSFKNLYVTGLFALNEDSYLVATHRNGLFIYENNKLRKWETPVNKFLKENQVYCGQKLTMKNASTTFASEYYFAFGTIQNGLLIIDKQGNAVQHLNKSKGLQNNTVLDIFQDANSNLWLGLDNGVDFIELSSPFTVFNDIIGFPGTTYALEFFRDKIYVGTNQGVFIKNQSEIEDVLAYSDQASIVPGTEGQVWSFFKDNNNLLCGHHEGIFSIRNSRAVKLNVEPGGWIIFPYLDGNLFAGQYDGIYSLDISGIFDNKVKSSVPYYKLNGFDETSRIIEIDKSDSSLWVAHGYKGIYRLTLNPGRDSITGYKLYDSRHGLPVDQMNNVFKIRNELVIGTVNGIYKKVPGKDTIVPHDFYAKYLGNSSHIRKMIEDDYGNIWLSVDEDIAVMILQTDGTYTLQTDQFKRIKSTLIGGFELIKIMDESNVFFGTNEGLIHYTPQITKDASSSFNVLLRRANFSGKELIKAYSGYMSKANEINPKEPDIIPFTSNSVRFVYSAVFYEDVKSNKYQIKLEGFDNEWGDWTKKTEKEYTNLHDGEYCFMVRAMNTYSKTSETARFCFVIAPPWYRSGLAYLIYIASALLLIFIIAVIIYNRFKKQQFLLTEEKRKELEAEKHRYNETSVRNEKEITRLRNEKLESENARKNTELASFAMQITQKNQILGLVQRRLTEVSGNVNEDAKKQLQELIKQIKQENSGHDHDEKFDRYFNEVHNNFLTRLTIKHPDLSPKEIKMCAYLRMNLSSKEIADLLNITTGGVEKSRYRIRKKLNLSKEDNLLEYILKF
jgi:ligand-binding sensor domain-containing protein/DNA-binding CsgD family transcriptional regulator